VTPSSTVSRSSATPTGKSTTPGPLIVIDPGHSGRNLRSIHAPTGLRDVDYPSYPEIYEMFDVSYCLGRALRLDGYRVRLTKERALDSVGLAERAKIANDLEADLAVSVHDDHGQSAAFQATYDQRGRTDASRRCHPHVSRNGTEPNRLRSAVGGPAESALRQDHLAGPQPVAAAARHRAGEQLQRSSPAGTGNLALVQLFARVPWVYNEMGAKTAGNPRTALSISSEQQDAEGLLVGIERALPPTGRSVRRPSAGARSLCSCLVQRVEPRPGRYPAEGVPAI
jgi:N-acetylmuramoyl-L-alanine amidase